MKKLFLLLAAVVSAFLALPQSAEGHHGRASFESTEITLKGTVTDFHFVNPHCVVEFEVKDDQGRVLKWEGQLSSASRLAPRGWTANSLEAGNEITITGYRAINGSPVIWVSKIVMLDGQELKLGGGR